MPFEYRIHPSVGIARMGDSPDAFFVGREWPVDRFEPILQTIPGKDATKLPGLKPFRDKIDRLAKQGARFRIFCYQYDNFWFYRDAHPTSFWEVTDADYDIEWRVKVSNKKSHDIPPKKKLRPTGATILWDAGPNEPAERKFSTAGDRGLKTFDGVPGRLPLGSAFVEAGGQLIVIGSDGNARAIPALAAAAAMDPPLRWKNWEDDAADGYVEATVTPKSNAASTKADKNEPPQDARRAWVVINLPNYGVDLHPAVTLYHFALNNALTKSSPGFLRPDFLGQITYADNIESLIKGYAAYRYVSYEARKGLPSDGVNSATTGHDQRPDDFYRSPPPLDVAKILSGFLREAWDPKTQSYENYWEGDMKPESFPDPVDYRQELRGRMPNLHFLAYPQHMKKWMLDWASGIIPNSSKSSAPAPLLLDMSHMCSMSGGSFYPGIEVGREACDYKKWTADYGVSSRHVDIRFNGAVGELTESLALPWHSDFVNCGKEWWPASRPVVVKQAPIGFYKWMSDGLTPIIDGDDLRTKWMNLGFIRFQPTTHEYHEDSRILPPGPPAP